MSEGYRRLTIPEKVAIFTKCKINSLETICRFTKLLPGRSMTSHSLINLNRKFDEIKNWWSTFRDRAHIKLPELRRTLRMFGSN